MRRGEDPDAVDDAISEFGWRAVQAGLHRLGREPTKEELDAVNRPCSCGSLFDPECLQHGKYKP